MKLAVCKEIPARLPADRIERLFRLIVRSEAHRGRTATVNLVVCTDSRMRTLNRRFRAIDRSTDVLSFNLDSPDTAQGVFGEIYISMPYVRRQAARCRKRLFDEFLLLFCHGMLHLFGYDHDTRSRERLMFERQAGYLRALEKGR